MYRGYEILLGSGSPRRRELLAAMDIDFSVIKLKDVDETYPADLSAHLVPSYLSRLKADAYKDRLTDRQLLLTADTCVIVDDTILGKPADRDEAIAMIHRLAGRRHSVVTGVTITSAERSHTFSEDTKVEFYPMTDSEIEHYVDKYRPFDKAGAYGIQEWIGMTSVRLIEGCFYNVMGLPAPALYHHLNRFIDTT